MTTSQSMSYFKEMKPELAYHKHIRELIFKLIFLGIE